MPRGTRRSTAHWGWCPGKMQTANLYENVVIHSVAPPRLVCVSAVSKYARGLSRTWHGHGYSSEDCSAARHASNLVGACVSALSLWLYCPPADPSQPAPGKKIHNFICIYIYLYIHIYMYTYTYVCGLGCNNESGGWKLSKVKRLIAKWIGTRKRLFSGFLPSRVWL